MTQTAPPPLPPKPPSRQDRVSLRTYARLFRRDILSAQPARLYGAWMAVLRTPFFRSFLINDPKLVDMVLKKQPEDFPKSDRINEGLRPLLGGSVFVTNGATWRRQRRIIDPAFEGGRLHHSFGAMWAAAEEAAARFARTTDAPIEIEAEMSHAAADVIFRTLFSLPIEDAVAQEVFTEFHAYQRSQPLLNFAALVPLPPWVPRLFGRATRRSAAHIRGLIRSLVVARQAEIIAGRAPDDLATKIMTTPDPETGACFDLDEMVDQVAIFFLAGHETSGSAMAWALYLLALYPEWQEQVAAEAAALREGTVAEARQLKLSRDVFRETLRLYPPVPMMVRSAAKPQVFRNRVVPRGSQIVISPWHLHRHTRFWQNPDGFDPARWQTSDPTACARGAFIPFSAGSRVCPGAGFAMMEGPLILSRLLRDFQVTCTDKPPPVPVAHLTVRSKNGIYLRVTPRR